MGETRSALAMRHSGRRHLVTSQLGPKSGGGVRRWVVILRGVIELRRYWTDVVDDGAP